MMSLLLGKFPDLVGERKRLQKIRKFEPAREVVPVHNFPLRHLLREAFEFLARERRHSSAARDAILAALESLGAKGPTK